MRWASVTLAVLALGEAVLIGRLLLQRVTTSAPAATAVTPPATAVTPPATAAASSPAPRPDVQTIEPPAVTSIPLVTATATADAKLPEVKTLPPPAPAVRTGGFRLSAPIELTVLDGDRVIGSTADGPIFATAGRREFEFVNSAIGFRSRQVVDVKAGQIISFTVPVPNGTLNINALPWATVFIDGNSVGETPLGNLSVTPGEHEIVFRHPQLGERRERRIVRSGIETRIAVDLQR
jgi:hypothetical protein